MHGRISPRRMCNPCAYTMLMSSRYHAYTMLMISRYHRLLIYDVKCTTKIDGMGPFNVSVSAGWGGCLKPSESTECKFLWRHHIFGAK